MKLHVDIETFSSVDIQTCGAYKYMESIDFEILLIMYAFDDQEIKIVSLAEGEKMPREFTDALQDPDILKCAHNANFERQAFKKYGFDIPAEQWYCTAVKSSYCGLPISLDGVSKALELGEHGKLATGKALIRYFCCPIKPTKANGMRDRNYWHHNPEKWAEFKAYGIGDVRAEREVDERLLKYNIPHNERINYFLDQKINDIGVLIDLDFAQNAFDFDHKFVSDLKTKVKRLTGLENPNSPPQLKRWLSEILQKEVKTLAAESVKTLIEDTGAGAATEVLKIRQMMSKTSVKKYIAMLSCACDDGRGHGMFQFYGAGRTGRWAGRLVQLHNLPKNKIDYLEEAREVVSSNDYDLATLLYDDISYILSQLIRTAFIPKPGHTFAVADFSSIEARVIAWLAGEKWRLDVFNTHGKIYEASAAAMYGVPMESITKTSVMREKGKIAELALGYQGAVGALKTMGGEKMGLSESEMNSIVKKWRKASPAIVALWGDMEFCAIRAMKSKGKTIVSKNKGLEFQYDGQALTIKLPSGRKLFYWKPSFTVNQWDNQSIRYLGMNQTTKQWGYVDTYGGKITENVVQAIARDLLAYSMQKIDAAGFGICMHVHDEIVGEIPFVDDFGESAAEQLETICDIMGEKVSWAEGLPLKADGYLTDFYKKD